MATSGTVDIVNSGPELSLDPSLLIHTHQVYPTHHISPVAVPLSRDGDGRR